MKPRRVAAALACAAALQACASRTASIVAPGSQHTVSLARWWDADHVSTPYSPLVNHSVVEQRVRALPGDLFSVRALNLVTPEGRLLKQMRDELKPIVGFNQGASTGGEITLPDWTAERPSRQLVQTGSAANLMLVRPLANGRYRVERVLSGTWRVDQ